MPVAKDGKKGKGQSTGLPGDIVKVLLDSVFPDKKHLTLTPKKEKGKKGQKDQAKKDGSGMVATYAKSISEHMLRHYEMFSSTISKGVPGTPFNLMDLIYYHTFGDYRMTYQKPDPTKMGDTGRISFEYRTIGPAEAGSRPHGKGTAIRSIISRNQIPGINYVYEPTVVGAVTSYGVSRVPWLDQELKKGSDGLRLMLPSIGTLMMQTYGYGNINIPLQKLVTEIAVKLDSVLESIDGNDILDYLEGAILDSEEYKELSKPGDRDEMGIEVIFQEARDKVSGGASKKESIAYLMQELIKSTTSRFAEGETVKFKPKAGLSSDEQDEIAELVGPYNDYEEELFTVDGLPQKRDKTYDYTLKYEGSTLTFTVKQSDLIPSGSPDVRFVEKQNKSFVAIPEPKTIVFYSILVDQLFALQAYLFTIKSSDKLNFGYLSPNIMADKKSSTAAKLFPNMYTPNKNSRPEQQDYLKKGKNIKNNQGLLAQLAVHRNLYTQLILKAQRGLAADTRTFDEFYKEDLTLKEVSWLATALSDEAKVLVEEPNKSDPLSQLVYKRPGGDPSEIQFTGEADRRTIFYTVDIPMLKEVMLEYIKVFNQFTISVAFAIQSGGLTKEGQVAKALWTSLRKRSEKILENNEAVPHEFFDTLFEEVKSATDSTGLAFDLFPPSWSGTNVLTTLTVDPAELGTIISIEEYQKYLNEYIEFIYTKFGNRAKVAAAITTSLESYRIKAATNYQELREDFIKMLMEHEKKKQIKATSMVFRAYNVVISIMRAELAIPLGLRDDMIAQGMEREALSQQLRERPYGQRGVAAVPPEHPLAQLKKQQAETRTKQEEEKRIAEDLERAKEAQEAREARIPPVTVVGIGSRVGGPVAPPGAAIASGVLTGGEEFSIFGTGFTNDRDQPISVTFDGIEAYSSTVMSPTEIRARNPAAAAGKVVDDLVDVVVTKSLRLPDGSLKEHSSATLPGGLKYS